MKVEYINPFLAASFHVLESLLHKIASKGSIGVKASPGSTKKILIVLGVKGEPHGIVTYALTKETAIALVREMTMGEYNVTEIDEIVKSALKEIGNMITGRATMGFEESGYSCDITTPTLFIDNAPKFPEVQTLSVPIITHVGEIEVNIALKAS